MDYNELFDILTNIARKLVSPEEWIALDMQFSKSEVLTLLQVDRNGEIIMSRIADYMNIPMSTATGVVERLVKKGYLERTRDEGDRRIVTIRLTQAGRDLVLKLKDKVNGTIGKIYQALNEDEKKLLAGLISKIAGILTGMNAEDGSQEVNENKMRKIEID